MSWISDIVDWGGNLLGGGDTYSVGGGDNYSSIGDLFSSGSGGGGGGSSLWSSPGLWSSVIGAGAGLLQNSQQIDANEEALKAKNESDKFNYLIELAKLKYAQPKGGGGGGGGGSTRNKNADLIDVLASGTDDRLKALGQLSSGISGALLR